MTQSWLSNNNEMETVLLSHGIPRHLGWTLMSQIAEWAVATHGISEKLHLIKQQEAQAYLDMLEAMPYGKRPLNNVLGMNLDKAVVLSARHTHWETTREQFKTQQLSLEYARALRDQLAATRESPDLPRPKGIENGDSLWLISNPSAVILGSVPMEIEEIWSSSVYETSQMRCYPLGYSGLNPARTKRPPDSLAAAEIWFIAPQFQEWVSLNLAPGAATMGDLVIPSVDPIAAVA